ncbi:MAG: tetratricopeptide repeat protein [Candidatus Brocadiaceae bacterium]
MKKILKTTIISYDKLILGFLYAIIIIVPLVFDIRIYSVFDLSKLTVLYLLSLGIIGVWSIKRVSKSDFRFFNTPLDIPMLAYIGVFILTTILSINPLMSLFGTYKRFEGLTATLCYVFLYYTVVNFVTTRKRLYYLIISIIATAVLASFYGIAQHLGLDIFSWSNFEARRVFSTFGNPVFFSAYLVMSLPLAVALFFNNNFQPVKPQVLKSSPIIWLFFTLSLIMYATFWLTNTRACFVALLGGLTPLLIVMYKIRGKDTKRFIILVASFLLIGVFFNVRHETSVIKHFTADVKTPDITKTSEITADSFLQKEIQPPLPEQYPAIKRPLIATRLSVTGSSFSRIFQYLAALEIIKDYPLFGIGPDTIGIVYQKYFARVFSLQESDGGFPFPRQDRIHNDILDTLVTRGVFGLGTYIWLLFTFAYFVRKNYTILDMKDKTLLLSLLAGIICYLIQNEFSFGNTPIVSLFWIMMGSCVSLIKISKTERPEQTGDRQKIVRNYKGEELKSFGAAAPQPSRLPNFTTFQLPGFFKYLWCGVFLIAIGFVSIFIFSTYKADVYFEYGRRVLEYRKANAEGSVDRGLYFIRHAIFLNPYETFYRDELCRTYLKMAHKTKDRAWIEQAFEEAQNSINLIPQHYLGFFHLGMINQMLFEFFGQNTIDLAIDYYKKGIEMDTFQSPFHGNVAALYLNKGNLDLAIEELYQAYLIRPDEPSYIDRLVKAYLEKDRPESAIRLLSKTIDRNPGESSYYNNLGVVLSKNGKYEEASKRFKKAMELNPGEQTYTINFATSLTSLGNYTDALQTLQSFQMSYPERIDLNMRLFIAHLFMKISDWEKAVFECEQIIKIDEKLTVAHKMLGVAYFNMQQYDRSRKELRQTLALDPNDQETKDLLTKIPSQ